MRATLVGCLLAALLLSACSDADEDQARLCLRAAQSLVGPEAGLEVLANEGGTVRLAYRLDRTSGEMTCRFAGHGWSSQRLELQEIRLAGKPLSAVQFYLLKRYGLGFIAADRSAPQGPLAALGYLLQQLVNALTVGSHYGLIALGFGLIFGVLRRVHLAHGDFATLGGYAALSGVGVAAAVLPLAAFALPAAMVLAVGTAALAGLVLGRSLLAPLAAGTTQAALVATLGLAIGLREGLRLAQGAGDRWLQPLLGARFTLGDLGGFSVTVTATQIMTLLIALWSFLWVRRLLRRNSFGRAWRAVAEDAQMARLCGLDADRVLALTLSIAAGLSALAGFAILIHYGGIGPYMGLTLGLKGLTAAVLGGLGAPLAGFAGGLVLGLLEALWAGYLDLAYRDVAVYSVLALLLILRPQGLFASAPPFEPQWKRLHRRL